MPAAPSVAADDAVDDGTVADAQLDNRAAVGGFVSSVGDAAAEIRLVGILSVLPGHRASY